MNSPIPSSAARAKRLPEGWLVWLIGTVTAYIALLILTRPLDYVDSLHYAKHVADQYNLQLAANTNPFYDFGHVLWRPLVYLLWSPIRGPLQAMFNGDDILAVAAVEIAINIAGGLLAAIFLFFTVARTTRNAKVACITTIGYLSTNALLTYSQNGVAYGLGIAFQVVAICVLQYALSEGKFTFFWGVLSGSMLGLSIVTWFPYILGAGGIGCYALLTRDTSDAPKLRERMAGLAGLIAGTAAMTVLIYGIVMAIMHLTTVDSFMEWMARSRYGKEPDRGVLRMLGGIPRSFLALGDLNVTLKRMLFEDRTFSLTALVETGIWKVALVYSVLSTAVVALWRSSWGRIHLVCLSALAIPLGIFAAFLFEGAPAERYLAAFPLLFLAFGHILADQRRRFARGWIGLFFVCMLATNVVALSRFGNETEFAAASARLRAINEKLLPQDQIVLMSYRDAAFVLVNAQPFSPLSKNRYLFSIGLPWGITHKERWRMNFANSTRKTWGEGGRVWLSTRFVSPTPDPAWGWVEGDLVGIGWQDLTSFFRQLTLVDSFGGTDGFAEVARTAENERLFREVIGSQAP